jgi:hypothetical protein
MAITGASFKPIAAVALLTVHLKVYQVRDQDAGKIGSNGVKISPNMVNPPGYPSSLADSGKMTSPVSCTTTTMSLLATVHQPAGCPALRRLLAALDLEQIYS